MNETETQIPDKKKADCAKGGYAKWKGKTKAQRSAELKRVRSFGTNGPKREEVAPVRDFLKKAVRNALISKNPLFMARFPEGVARVSIVREVVTLHPSPMRVSIPKNRGASLLDRTKAQLAGVGIV